MIELREGTAADWPVYREILAHSPEAATWVDSFPSLAALKMGKVVGFALYRIVAGEGELLNLAVFPDQRRSGIATALLTALMQKAELWHLEVRESNVSARALYSRLHFEEVGKRSGYYRDGEAAILMSRFGQSA